MVNMGEIVADIKAVLPDTFIFIGGAPVNSEYCKKIGADAYTPDPQGVVEWLAKLVA
jgi:5-methyltetrahydrofolate--homocysteine methyltransferase